MFRSVTGVTTQPLNTEMGLTVLGSDGMMRVFVETSATPEEESGLLLVCTRYLSSFAAVLFLENAFVMPR